VLCQSLQLGFTVIPAQAGIQIAALVSRLRGNDVTQKLRFDKALATTFAVHDEKRDNVFFVRPFCGNL